MRKRSKEIAQNPLPIRHESFTSYRAEEDSSPLILILANQHMLSFICKKLYVESLSRRICWAIYYSTSSSSPNTPPPPLNVWSLLDWKSLFKPLWAASFPTYSTRGRYFYQRTRISAAVKVELRVCCGSSWFSWHGTARTGSGGIGTGEAKPAQVVVRLGNRDCYSRFVFLTRPPHGIRNTPGSLSHAAACLSWMTHLLYYLPKSNNNTPPPPPPADQHGL